jgi:hypothetical protein
MTRTFHIALAAAAIGLALALPAAASSAPAPKTVQGTVGPDFTINLTIGGKKVTTRRRACAIAF